MSGPPRAVTVSVVAALTLVGCGDDGPSWPNDAADAVVSVHAQPCDSPNRSSGSGVRLADGVVVTAAHIVEDDLRDLRVDDLPASVLAIDARTDLALLRTADHAGPSIALAPAAVARAATRLWLLAPGDDDPDWRAILLDGVRATRLTVHDATAGETYERDAIAFPGVVAEGTSGAPIVTGDGRVAGIVILAVGKRHLSYAVAAGEVAALLARTAAWSLEPIEGCA